MTDGEACTVLLRSFFPALKMDSGSYFGRGRMLVRPIYGGEPTTSGIRFRRDFSDRGEADQPTNRQQLVFRLPHLRDKTYIQLIGMRSLR